MKGLIIIDFNRTLYFVEEDRLHDGSLDFLEKYGGSYVLALISKTQDTPTRLKLIKKLGVEHHFDIIFVRDKKGLEEFHDAMQQTGFGPEQTWCIGDRIKSEISVSKQLGIKSIWFRHGKFADEEPENKGEEPDYMVKKWKEIEKIIPL